MLPMCEPFFTMGKSVVTSIIFVVANGIVALAEKRVYAVDLIKKRCYQPQLLPGDTINHNFQTRR